MVRECTYGEAVLTEGSVYSEEYMQMVALPRIRKAGEALRIINEKLKKEIETWKGEIEYVV
jgi:hypothetical protein